MLKLQSAGSELVASDGIDRGGSAVADIAVEAGLDGTVLVQTAMRIENRLRGEL